MIRSFLYEFERWVVVCGEGGLCRLDGGKGVDGGRESVALDILRLRQVGKVGMREWKVQVMLPVPNQFGRRARG